MVKLQSNNYHRIINYWIASALFGSTAIGYGDLFDRKVDDNYYYRTPALCYNNHYRTPPVSNNNQYAISIYNAYDIKSNINALIIYY